MPIPSLDATPRKPIFFKLASYGTDRLPAPDEPESLPAAPSGTYTYHDLPLHTLAFTQDHLERPFTQILESWYLEIDDNLFAKICPSDLNSVPCEWDELESGCQYLRLCSSFTKYPKLIPPAANPTFMYPRICTTATRTICPHIHDIEPNCRFVTNQLALRPEQQLKFQLCGVVNRGEMCRYGHDFESARLASYKRYWEHKEAAREKGTVGLVKEDCDGHRWARVRRP